MENLRKETIAPEILQSKIDKRIENNQTKIQQVLNKFEHDGSNMKDYVVELASDSFGFTKPKALFIQENDANLNDYSFGQVCDKLGVPRTYANGLIGKNKDWASGLLKDIFNEHCKNDDRERALLRVVDGQVRGFLSDSYKRMDSYMVAKSFIESSDNYGAVIVDGYINDTKMFLETINPNLIPIETEDGNTIYIVVGARFKTSDFGDGAIDLSSYIEQAVCSNGMCMQSMMRSAHLGAKLHKDLQLSERTYQLDTQTTASAVSDLTINCFKPSTTKKIIDSIVYANKEKIDLNSALTKLSKNKSLTEGECLEIKSVFMANNVEDGLGDNNSLFRLTQGITAIARMKEGQKKRDLESLAGTLLVSK